MEGYHFYIINLNRSKDRWNNMKTHYDNDNIVRIEGYDGNIIDSYNDIKYAKYNYKNLGELGCSLSHVKAIKMAYENGLNEVFIMEDDILNTYKNKWRYTLRGILHNKPKDAECITFFSNNLGLNQHFIKTPYLFSRYEKIISTGVYYINRNGMKKIYELYVKNNIIDLTSIKYTLVADIGLLYPIMNTYHYTKPTFIDKIQESYIQTKEHINKLHVPNNLLLKQYFHNQPNYNRYK